MKPGRGWVISSPASRIVSPTPPSPQILTGGGSLDWWWCERGVRERKREKKREEKEREGKRKRQKDKDRKREKRKR